MNCPLFRRYGLIAPTQFKSLSKIVPALILIAAASQAPAAIIAKYTFETGTVTGANTSSAAATSTIGSPGVTASTFTVVGGTGSAISISEGTQTTYQQGNSTPAIAQIYNGTIYATFNLNFSTAYSLTSLGFEMGGSNILSTASPTSFAFGAQIQIGSGAFNNLPVNAPSTPVSYSTASFVSLGQYTADLSSYQNVTGSVTIRIFFADDASVSNSAARIKNVTMEAASIPEPNALLSAGTAVFAAASLRRRRA